MDRTIENRKIKNCILQIYSEAKCRYGAQKMRKVLETHYGISISQGRVYRLMKQMQPPKMSTIKPKFKAANKSDDRVCYNILKQNFNPKEPNKAWCSDVTYIKVGGKFCYLCVILLHQLTLEDFMRRTTVERRGRKPQEYAHISRFSDEVFRHTGKQKNSRVGWGSNNRSVFQTCNSA